MTVAGFLSGFGAIDALSRNSVFFTPVVTKVEIKALEEQIAYLQNSNDASSSAHLLESLKREHASLARFRTHREYITTTVLGKMRASFGTLFSWYCAYKIVVSFFNVALTRNPKRDPVTLLLQLTLPFFSIDAAFWSHALSFGLVFALLVNSVKSILTTAVRYFPGDSLILVSMVVGMYFCSSLMLMRMNLPPDDRPLLEEIVGGGDRAAFGSYHRWFDLIFLISSIFFLVFRIFILRSFQFHKSADSIV